MMFSLQNKLLLPVTVVTFLIGLMHICQSAPLNYNSSAIDIDGDSIVYELYNPYVGGTWGNPIKIHLMARHTVQFFGSHLTL